MAPSCPTRRSLTGIGLAESIGAGVTGIHVSPTFHTFSTNPLVVTDTHEDYEKAARALGDRSLRVIEDASRGAGVPFQGVHVLHDHSEQLRTRGWTVPAYKLPPALDTTDVLRIVVRNGFSRDLAAILLDLQAAIDRLNQRDGRHPDRTGFHH